MQRARQGPPLLAQVPLLRVLPCLLRVGNWNFVLASEPRISPRSVKLAPRRGWAGAARAHLPAPGRGWQRRARSPKDARLLQAVLLSAGRWLPVRVIGKAGFVHRGARGSFDPGRLFMRSHPLEVDLLARRGSRTPQIALLLKTSFCPGFSRGRTTKRRNHRLRLPRLPAEHGAARACYYGEQLSEGNKTWL